MNNGRACLTWGIFSPRSVMHGRKRPFSIVFEPFHINRITAVFYRIVIECKRSDTAFSHRIRSFSTVYDTVKYGPYETGQIRVVYGHKRQYVYETDFSVYGHRIYRPGSALISRVTGEYRPALRIFCARLLKPLPLIVSND